MPMNLNEAPEQREYGVLIPDGSFVKLKGHIRPGKASIAGCDKADEELFTKSKSDDSDAVYLDWEFTVMHGPHARSKLWQIMVIFGGSVDEKGQSKAGNISKATIRAMWESALGIEPNDESAEARQKRILECFSHLDGIEFAARVGIEKGGDNGRGGNYPDKNRIAFVVTPDLPEWQAVMAGQEVAPKPTGAVAARGNGSASRAAADTKPAWQREAAPASASASSPAPAAPAMAVAAGTSGPAWLRK